MFVNKMNGCQICHIYDTLNFFVGSENCFILIFMLILDRFYRIFVNHWWTNWRIICE